MKHKDGKVRDSGGVILKYPERDCIECINYPCFEGINNLSCNFAKYGCQQYDKESIESRISDSSK